MKNILGLDLGTTSIGWAFVKEAEKDNEQSSIVKLGVRVNPLTVDEQAEFEKGKPITVNASRTLRRGMRRNLNRYQLRRDNLINALKNAGLLTDKSGLVETGPHSTHSTWALRAKAASEKITTSELARVLLAINKKRGYKSSRTAHNEDEGQIIDSMAVAKTLYEENLTPGQLTYQLLKEGKKYLPDYYRSDLKAEFDKVWNCQRQFYPEVFTDKFYRAIDGKGQKATASSFWTIHKFNTAENKGNWNEKKMRAYEWRSRAVTEKLDLDKAAYVIAEINNNINSSSGYLGAISDRSKELYFKKETVGQYLYRQLQLNPHTRLKNQVFYRQDYLDEFETIWGIQSKYHAQLTDLLKSEIRDIIIFYQRKLKSQKGLISFCEFESSEKEILIDGRKIKKTIGLKAVPKSSPLFQEFKIWQIVNNLEIVNKIRDEILKPVDDLKPLLFDELNIKGNLTSSMALDILGYKPKQWEIKNYKELEGNRTQKTLYQTYLNILELEGYDVKDLLKVKDNSKDLDLGEISLPAAEIKHLIKSIFPTLGINTDILEFNAELDGKAFEQQPGYQLWHLLYSYEGDNSASGNDRLYALLEKKFGFKREHARLLGKISFSDDYGNLSTKAIRKIYPYIKESKYSEACALAGYRHSASSLTKDEIANRPLASKLELLKKNSLRNPVVEKILNQMVNVVNTLIDDENAIRLQSGLTPDFHFDEIRIELARELKKNAKERADMTSHINTAKTLHEKIFKVLQTEFGVKNPTRNDIIRYKLYEELKTNGYKDLYSNTYIPRERLFSKEIDIEHIIPQSILFDDSFSNKTIVYRKDNLAKGNQTAYDYIDNTYGHDALEEYIARVERVFHQKEEPISKAKYQKLLKKETEIGDGFIERDLRESQYIAKKAKDILFTISRSVISTTGSITDRLREDWGLINLMQELNFEKYKKLGLTEKVEKKDGTFKDRIMDWSKRNDHRHHAMDAMTIAFTKHNHIQYLNHLNARKNEHHKLHYMIRAIEAKETEIVIDNEGNKKRIFKDPFPNFRHSAMEHLERVLVSHKAKNKVTTQNKNKIKTRRGEIVRTELTPRGQLHKETVYGKLKQYVIKEEAVGGKFDTDTIGKVSNPKHKQALLVRLSENGNDPKRAFTGKNALLKTPLYIDEEKSEVVPEKVKLVWLEEDFTIRKDITPDIKIEKVIDQGIKRILENRLKEYGNDPKKAFTDLEKNPIWLNKGKGISVKRVTISGVKNADALHYKKDHFGNTILDEKGQKIPVDFISTGNNHHVAIYRDVKGNLQDTVVSFYEAVARVNQGLPVIDKLFNSHLGWSFQYTLKQNEYFIFPNEQIGFNPTEIELLDSKNNNLISINLFRVQKLSKVSYGNSSVREYVFRHHLETNVEEKKELKDLTFKNIKSLSSFENVVKVRVNHIGQIVKIGEY